MQKKTVRIIAAFLVAMFVLVSLAAILPSALADTLKGRINASDVNLRKGPGTGYGRVAVLREGDEVSISGEDSGWYEVSAGRRSGYVRSDFVSLGAQAQKELNAGTVELQTRLKELGYYAGDVDGDYGVRTAAAVKCFQYASGLEADGKAGENTLAALAAAGRTDSCAASVARNGPVILAEWFNAMKADFPKYEGVPCVDVATGESFTLRCFSKGNHADVEPLTREDTETLYRINGNRWSWTPRALWVYVNGEVYAAAINVMPHGPDTLPDNGMSGQICMHFYCSRQHNTGAENRNLQAAVLRAFEKGEQAPELSTLQTGEEPLEEPAEPEEEVIPEEIPEDED